MKNTLLLILAVSVFWTCGCANMSHGEKGALAGGTIGAGTGALIGHATGNTGAGAAIGAGIGAISGALMGNAVDESEKKAEAQLAAATQPASGPLGMTDVVQLSNAKINDGVIISQIRTSGSVFHLSPQDTIWLKQSGVSDVVVQEMMATASRHPRAVYGTPVYVVEPRPPVHVGVGFGYGRRCGW